MRTQNPDIDWEFGTIKWRSAHCHKHCIPSEVVIETISLEDLSQENPDLVFQLGAVIFHYEDGNDIALRLPSHYQEWADVFNQEKILALSILKAGLFPMGTLSTKTQCVSDRQYT